MAIKRANGGGLGGSGSPGGALGEFFSTTIDNSLRLNSDSSYLYFAQGTPTDISKWTINFWLKRAHPLDDSSDYDAVFGVDGPGTTGLAFLSGQLYLFINYNTGGSQARLITNRVFRDPSAWYNFHITFDRANGTAAQRLRLYVNGVEETSFATDERSSIASDSSSGWNVSGLTAAINRRSGAVNSRYHNGYFAQFYNIDGAVVAPTSFAETKDGVWIPKAYSGSYGNNGWLLEFKQTGTGTASSSTVGADTSGNNNHWTSSGVAAHDVVPDSPTKNFAVMNPLMIGDARVHSSASYSEGNLNVAGGGFSTSTIGGGYSTIAIPKDKKIYIEVCETGIDGTYWAAGILIDNHVQNSTQVSGDGAISTYNRQAYVNGVEINYGASAGLGGLGVAKMSAGDVLGVAVDGATGKVWFHLNGTYFKSPTTNNSGTTGNPSAGTNEIGTVNNTASNNPSGEIFFFINNHQSSDNCRVNFGQDSTFAGSKSAGSQTDSNGDGLFQYAVPTDYVCLHSGNMSDVTIGPTQSTQAEDHFETVLFTGNGGSNDVSSLSFQPDMTIIGPRNYSGAQNYQLYDSLRSGQRMRIDSTSGQDSGTGFSFTSDGFDIGADGLSNANTYLYCSWNFKAGGTANTFNIDGTGYASMSAAPISDGTLALASLTANTTAGFSMATFNMPDAEKTVAHGLGVKPEMIILRKYDSSNHWMVWFKEMGENTSTGLRLNDGSSAATSFGGAGNWFQSVSSTLVGLGPYGSYFGLGNQIMYSFASKEGYSRVGSYEGNASADGTFIYTGFRPAFILLRNFDAANFWFTYDNRREGFNESNDTLSWNYSSVEDSTYKLDIISNGFKIRSSQNAHNQANTFVYMAIAEAPLKFANAR